MTDFIKVMFQGIERFFKNGVNHKDNCGMTLLMWASYEGDFDTVSKLLKAGTDVNLRDLGKNTALHLSLNDEYNRLDIVSELIEAGADINLQNNRGKTALMMASEYGYLDIVSKLIEVGADVNLEDNDGQTAFLLSLNDVHLEIVSGLLSKGVDGQAVFLLSLDDDVHLKIISQLLAVGVDINHQDSYHQTVLMIAYKNSFVNVISLLLSADADVNIQNSDDGSVLEMMRKECHDDSALTVIQDLDSFEKFALDKIFDVDPYLWTKVSKHYSKRVFDYFVGRYSDLLNVSRDVIQSIF